jgi:glycosyltransferase involved in cell wall biosynthesis
MTTYTLNDLELYYGRVKRMAHRAFERGRIGRALSHIEIAATLAYNLNYRYADPELESLMARISERLTGGAATAYPVHEGRWLFYDQITGDTVLSLQYLRALMAWGVEILYVLDTAESPRGSVIAELRAYPKATVLVLDTRLESRVEMFGPTLDTIRAWGPARAMIHSPAGGAFGVAMLHALVSTVKYRIVPGDHHFWLGTGVTDYAIEFRPFGATVAMEKRGIERDRIMIQPYYPIIKEAPFEGFGFDTAGRTVIFSGGSYYKILGGDESFFRIAKMILDRHPDAVMQYSGWGTSRNREKVRDLLKKYRLTERLHLTGSRSDVNEVMKRCDIYLGTYPLCGGLMSQLAAASGRPILQYVDGPEDEVNRIEDIIGLDDPSARVTFASIEALAAEADRLITSPEARNAVGEKLRRAGITPAEFASRLHRSIRRGESWTGPTVPIDYSAATRWYLSLANDFSEVVEHTLVGRYRLATVWLFPKAALRFVPSLPRVIWSRTIKLFKQWKLER